MSESFICERSPLLHVIIALSEVTTDKTAQGRVTIDLKTDTLAYIVNILVLTNYY